MSVDYELISPDSGYLKARERYFELESQIGQAYRECHAEMQRNTWYRCQCRTDPHLLELQAEAGRLLRRYGYFG